MNVRHDFKQDRDANWQKREEQFEVVGDYALRLQAAKKQKQNPFEFDWRKSVSIPYQNEAEKKAVEDYLDRREADTKHNEWNIYCSATLSYLHALSA